MGPERYLCQCGAKYLTGATEWDHLGAYERSNRIQQTLGLGVVLSLVALIFASLPATGVYFIWHSRRAFVTTALLIGVMPFMWMTISFYIDVALSIYRTRFR
jgi:hypothetical protein